LTVYSTKWAPWGYRSKSYKEREDGPASLHDRSRGHGKTGNVPFNPPVQRREGTKTLENVKEKEDREGRL